MTPAEFWAGWQAELEPEFGLDATGARLDPADPMPPFSLYGRARLIVGL